MLKKKPKKKAINIAKCTVLPAKVRLKRLKTRFQQPIDLEAMDQKFEASMNPISSLTYI